jgi:hypothetical protein
MAVFPSSKIDAALTVVALLSWVEASRADPLRLRGDALVEARSPVGLLVLHGEDRLKPWLDVETVTWLGSGGLHGGGYGEPLVATGDVLTLSVRARDRASGSELRAGRMVVSMGAVRPVQIDGARGLARLFGGTTVEAFGGVPVVRRFDYAAFDWTAGGRIGEAVGDTVAVGGSYALRHRGMRGDHPGGRDEEAGADIAITPAPWLTAAGRASFDLVTPGPVDALASISAQKRDVRTEIFTTHRSPGRLLPSTSLFSVLGDFPATSAGGTLRWRAFPRLELVSTGSLQVQGEEVGGQATSRATLSLDDAWTSSIGAEVRRVDFNGARWTGAKTVLDVPLGGGLRAASELEMVCPDHPRGRGAVWPWALSSLAWRSLHGWEIAMAMEGSSSPESKTALNALARLSHSLEGAPQQQRQGRGTQ